MDESADGVTYQSQGLDRWTGIKGRREMLDEQADAQRNGRTTGGFGCLKTGGWPSGWRCK